MNQRQILVLFPRTQLEVQLNSTFDQWDPKKYLRQYYAGPKVTEDEVFVLKYLIEFLAQHKEGFNEAIEVGCGPTIHHSIPLVPHINKIYFADFVQSNLGEIRSWMESSPEAHNWGVHFEEVLALEGLKPTPELMKARAHELRGKVADLIPCDVHSDSPIKRNSTFDLVTSFFCVDSITSSKQDYARAMGNLFSLIRPGGWMVMSALGGAKHYQVENLSFPSVQLREQELHQILSNGPFIPSSIEVSTIKVGVFANEGFGSIILARGKRAL